MLACFELPRLARRFTRVSVLAWAFVAASGSAAAQALNQLLNESVVFVPAFNGQAQLETTVFRPDGQGPFPVVVFNHHRQTGSPGQQQRFRPLTAVRFFLSRGYAVVAPMRQGFSRSSGWYVGAGCDVARNAREQASDAVAILDFLPSQSWADATRVIVAGHSHGGLAALAAGTFKRPEVAALINFSGGSRNSECHSWQHGLSEAVASFGQATDVPSLWIYADNDSFFGGLYREMHLKYSKSGARSQLASFAQIGEDGHYILLDDQAARYWQPVVEEFLASMQLPHVTQPQFARHLEIQKDDLLPATRFAALEEVSKVPHVSVFRGRSAYRSFLNSAKPRAFAVSAEGAFGWATGEQPGKRALDFCNEHAKTACKLYAVDDHVVWIDTK